METTECDRPDMTDPAVLGSLFDRHGRDLYRYLARRAGQAAEDLLSETFTVALERRHTYDRKLSVARAWLFGIATNLLRRHAEREVHALRLTARAAGSSQSHVTAHDSAVVDRVHADAVTRLLAKTLAEMPQRDRDVLLLISWADLPLAEVAVALSIPVGTVRSRLHRIRKLLRAELFSLTAEGDWHA
jgi:RNA polymerase sigma factor (sigma-70 family)